MATPIGTARDITLRALDILASADVLVAEDTRTLKHLLALHGIKLGSRPVWSHHDHSGAGGVAGIVDAIAAGKSVAYASEAGTPMVSDPGYELARGVLAADLPLISAPGPSAVITALTLAGLPTDRFLFAGFPPAKSAARKSAFQELESLRATLVFYESPKRIAGFLADVVSVLGAERPVVICRELTKRFEEVLRGTAQDLVDQIGGQTLKGECVVLIGGAEIVEATPEDIEAALRLALERLSVRDAAAEVSGVFGVPRKQAYQMALKLGADRKS